MVCDGVFGVLRDVHVFAEFCTDCVAWCCVVLCCVVLCCVVRDLYWFRFGLTALTDLTIHILTLSFLFVLFFYFGLSDSLYR